VPDPDLVPFEPPDHPTFRAAFRNIIESYPRALYDEEGLVRYRTRFLDSVLVTEPELIHDILVARAHLFRRDDVARQLLSPMLGPTSLFMAEGADWKWQRRAVAPSFQHDKLLLGSAGALDVQGFARALTTELDSFPWRFILTSFRAPSWLPYPGRRSAARAREHIYREAARLVAQRRQGPPARGDLLDLLLQALDEETGRVMTDEELVRNLATFMLAGHETTAVALTWTLWLLAKYPHVQDQVAAEAQATIGSGAVAAQQVERLTFTRQVLQEAMRLYPPAPAISRQPLAPLVLGGEQLTPATQVTITIYPLHRNRRVWKNPDSFDPDRFTVDETQARPRYAYLPFGAGPRVCIGASLAMIEATVVLAILVHAFRFSAVTGHRPHPVARVTLRPRGGMPLYIEPR
jgi:cytochrome P450